MDQKIVNKNTNEKKSYLPFLSALAGAVLLLFFSWEWNAAFAAFLAPSLLIYGMRRIGKVWLTLPVMLLSIAMKIAAMHGGWDISLGTEIAFGVLVTVPLIIALYLDRLFHAKLNPFVATLVFPATYIALDFLISLIPIGMTFSIPYVVSRQLILVQSASLLGSWFVGFVALWISSAVNLVSLKGMDNSRQKAAIACTIIFVMVMGYGAARLVFVKPESKTVKVGSISVTHEFDTWGITDRGTPIGEAAQYKKSFKKMEDELFRLSQKAVDGGAKIIFWSEGNGVMYEDDYNAFLKKASEFASKNRVYFMPGILVLHYNQTWNDNLAVMMKPDGSTGFRYEKTNSWYPSRSDGIIKTVDTPYGVIGSAICFDMDFPLFVHQASNVDIMLVPAYDTKKISPYHTEGALLRGVENGFSVIRQCNAGASMAADYDGNILASQDYFTTDERLMMSDVPTKGVSTLYNLVGDSFAWADIGLWILLVLCSVIYTVRKKV